MRIWSTLPSEKEVRSCFSYILDAPLEFSNIIGSRCDVVIRDIFFGAFMPWQIHLNILPDDLATHSLLAQNWHNWLAKSFPDRERLLTEEEKSINLEICTLMDSSTRASLFRIAIGEEDEENSKQMALEAERFRLELSLQVQELTEQRKSICPPENEIEYMDQFTRKYNRGMFSPCIFIHLLEVDTTLNFFAHDCFIQCNKKAVTFRKTNRPQRHRHKTMEFFPVKAAR